MVTVEITEAERLLRGQRRYASVEQALQATNY